MNAVMRLLRREALHALSSELGVEAHRLAASEHSVARWRTTEGARALQSAEVIPLEVVKSGLASYVKGRGRDT